MGDYVKDEDFDAFVGFVSQLQESRPNEYSDEKLTDDKIRYLIDEFYKENSELKTQMVIEIVKKTDNFASTRVGQIINKILAFDPVLGLSDEEIAAAPYFFKKTDGDVHDLLDERYKELYGEDKNLDDATEAQLFEFIKDKKAAYLVYAYIQNNDFVPVIAKTEDEQKSEKDLSLNLFNFDALFNTFASKFEDFNGNAVATGVIYNISKQEKFDQNLKLEAREYIISGDRNSENDIAFLKKLKNADEELFEKEFKAMFSASELENLKNIGAVQGINALDQKDKERIIKIYKNDENRIENLSYYEAVSRLGLDGQDTDEKIEKKSEKNSEKISENRPKNIVKISKKIKNTAKFKEVVEYNYKMEAGLIEPAQMKVSLSYIGEEDVLLPILKRFVTGSQSITDFDLSENQKRDKIMWIARGFVGFDEILTDKLKEEEKATRKAIDTFERTHLNIRFSSLDLSEQNKYYAEFYEGKATPDDIAVAEIEYINKLISSGAILNEKGKKIGAKDVKLIQNIIQEIMDKKGSKSIEAFLSSETNLGFSVKNFGSRVEMYRCAVSNISDTLFANLVNQARKGVTEIDQNARDAFETAKRQIVEQNYFKRVEKFKKENLREPTSTDLYSKVPDVENLSQLETKNFRFRISLLNRRVNDDQDSEILLNILRNCCFVNEDVMVQKMAEIQLIDSDTLKTMTTEELKAVLTPATVNKFFSENQQLKNIMLQTGANDITLALSAEQLAERELEEVVADETFKTDVLQNLSGKKDKLSLAKAEKEYFYSDGKVRKDKIQDVISAISNLKQDFLFAELMYDAVVDHVSYGSSDEEQAKFFMTSRANLPAPKNIAEAVKRQDSVLCSKTPRKKAKTQVSSSVVKTETTTSARIKEAQEEQKQISIISKRIADINRTFKGNSREYAEMVKPVLEKYAGQIYNEKRLASQLLGRPLASESTPVQQREITIALQNNMVKAAKRVDYLSKYIPATGNVNDPKFIGGLTRAKSEAERRKDSAKLSELEIDTKYIEENKNRLSNIVSYMQNSVFSKELLNSVTRSNGFAKFSDEEKVEKILQRFNEELIKYRKIVSINNLGRRVDYGKYSDMRARKVLHEAAVGNKLQTELMRENSEYKALVEKLEVIHKDYVKVKEQIERVSSELDDLESPSTPKTDDIKRRIRDTKKLLSDLQIKLNLIEPSVLVTQEKIRKIELAHAEIYADKQVAGAKTRDVFEDYVLLDKNGVEINVSNNLTLKKQINDAINKYSSSMASDIDRINKEVISDKLEIQKFELKSADLSNVVKQASQIARILNKQKTALKTKLEQAKNDAERKKISDIIDHIDANVSRVKSDTKILENILGKAGVAEIKIKDKSAKK